MDPNPPKRVRIAGEGAATANRGGRRGEDGPVDVVGVGGGGGWRARGTGVNTDVKPQFWTFVCLLQGRMTHSDQFLYYQLFWAELEHADLLTPLVLKKLSFYNQLISSSEEMLWYYNHLFSCDFTRSFSLGSVTVAVSLISTFISLKVCSLAFRWKSMHLSLH